MDRRRDGGRAETVERAMTTTERDGCHGGGRTSTSLQRRENERKTERERKKVLERKTERIRVETGKCRTEFKDCTVKALFKAENLITLL